MFKPATVPSGAVAALEVTADFISTVSTSTISVTIDDFIQRLINSTFVLLRMSRKRTRRSHSVIKMKFLFLK